MMIYIALGVLLYQGLVIENAGKKTLLSIGYFGMTVSMALLTVTLYLQVSLS